MRKLFHLGLCYETQQIGFGRLTLLSRKKAEFLIWALDTLPDLFHGKTLGAQAEWMTQDPEF